MRLKKLREANCMTQAELAFACGVTVTTVSRWETGKASPRKSSIDKIAEVLSVNVETVLEILEKGV